MHWAIKKQGEFSIHRLFWHARQKDPNIKMSKRIQESSTGERVDQALSILPTKTYDVSSSKLVSQDIVVRWNRVDGRAKNRRVADQVIVSSHSGERKPKYQEGIREYYCFLSHVQHQR